MPVVSIVTPFFNTPHPLFEACADSVLAQTFGDFEWIVVDDGSKPESAAFLEDFAETDSRIRVMRQDNAGVSAARNTALEAMDGRFFTFLDSDDLLSPTFLAEAVETLERTGADVAYGVLRREDDKSRIGADTSGLELEIVEGERLEVFRRGQLAGERLDGIAEIRKYAPYPIAPKVYRAASFPELRFAVGMPVGEDSLFNAMALASASRLVLVPSVWYTYVAVPGSASRKPDEEKMLGDLLGFENFIVHAARFGWSRTDVAMRYLHTVINMLAELAPHLSLLRLARFAGRAMALPPARWTGHIALSDYLVSRQFTLLASALVSGRFRLASALLKARPALASLRSLPSRLPSSAR